MKGKGLPWLHPDNSSSHQATKFHVKPGALDCILWLLPGVTRANLILFGPGMASIFQDPGAGLLEWNAPLLTRGKLAQAPSNDLQRECKSFAAHAQETYNSVTCSIECYLPFARQSSSQAILCAAVDANTLVPNERAILVQLLVVLGTSRPRVVDPPRFEGLTGSPRCRRTTAEGDCTA